MTQILKFSIRYSEEGPVGISAMGGMRDLCTVGHKLGSVVGKRLGTDIRPRAGVTFTFPFLGTPDREPVRLEEVRSLSFCSPVFSSLFLFSSSSLSLGFPRSGFFFRSV